MSPLSARDLLRISHVFVTHLHIDHFIGFDALLRVSVGREKTVRMVGPEGFRQRVHHKLQGYEWDLVDRYDTELVFEVTELHREGYARAARFRFKNRFAFEELGERTIDDGVVASEGAFDVFAAILEHHGPCLGFAVRERAHVNVWKNRLDKRGLPTGQWLQALKRAVLEEVPGDTPIKLPSGKSAPLADLRELATITEGQKIAYVADVADTTDNRCVIAALAEGADTLFIEARFAADETEQARQRAHLTTTAAGEIARKAGVRRLEPFHFSPRHEGKEQGMLDEVAEAFGRPLTPT